MKINWKYITYLIVVSLLIAEVSLRAITKQPIQGYQYILGKPWYYVLPFKPDFSHEPAVPSDTGYRIYDDKLGWNIGKLAADPPLYFSDDRGLRCTETEYRTKQFQKGDDFDVICIGNSFTHGDAIKFEDCWTSQWQRMTGKKILNLGVGGYGIDQATLKYQYSPYHAKVILLGMIAGDLDRSLSTIYNFFNGGIKSKPRFVFNGSSVSLLNSPCAYGSQVKANYEHYDTSQLLHGIYHFEDVVLRHDVLDFSYLYRTVKSFSYQRKQNLPPVYRTDDDRLAYNLKIIRYLDSLCKARGSKLEVLILANTNTFEDENTIPHPWSLFVSKLKEAKIAVLDPSEIQYKAWKADHRNIINAEEKVHYSPQGNSLVAQFLLNNFEKQ
jgi:hypothetical protein